MAERRQLPPQIRRVELARRAGSKPVVRYQLTVDTGVIDGKRKQLRRRYRTEKEARAALAEIQGQVNAGSYVQPSTLTVEQACADWLQSRHKIRPTTAAGYEYVLQPVRSELGDFAVQDLTRRHIDELIVKLRAGSLERPGGRARKPWSARSCNYMLGALSQVLAQLVAEGRLARNVAGLVDRVPGKARKFETFTTDQVRTVLSGIADDRNRHACILPLPAYGAAKSRACVGTTSIWTSERCGSARLASTWQVAPSIKTIPRRPQLAERCPYRTLY
jgi:integrase